MLVVVDHDTGRLVWAGKDRTVATLRRFFDDLGPERSRALTHVSADRGGVDLHRGHRAPSGGVVPGRLLWRPSGYADVEAVVAGRGVVGSPEVGIIRRRVGFRLFSP
jgi:hypothetical protein